jgi:hypothetical protein
MLFAVLVCVLVCVARGQQQPPRDSSCGDNDCVNPETNCSTPENCTPSVGGGPAVPGCGCNCVGCASCVQEINPVFNKQVRGSCDVLCRFGFSVFLLSFASQFFVSLFSVVSIWSWFSMNLGPLDAALPLSVMQ